jgi:hypothetical protein
LTKNTHEENPMSKDVECPYCGADIEICHDDGFGYSEDQLHEYECHECEKNFVFYTSISIYHEAYKADCLNGAPHNMKPAIAYPNFYPERARCEDCGHEENGPFDKAAYDEYFKKIDSV